MTTLKKNDRINIYKTFLLLKTNLRDEDYKR